MFDKAMWVSVPEKEYRAKCITQRDMNGRFAYFRCEAELPRDASLNISITACARYRLWVNGEPVLSGPCKGDRFRHYVDEIEVSEYLRDGMNVFAVQVLATEPFTVNDQLTDERLSIIGVASVPAGHRLAVEGDVFDRTGRQVGTITSGIAPWTVYLDDSFYLKSNEITVNLGGIIEEIDFSKVPHRWKLPEALAEDWSMAFIEEPCVLSNHDRSVGYIKKFPLRQRTIPLMHETFKTYKKEIGSSGILERPVTVSANSVKTIILDAGEVENAYTIFRFKKGRNAKIKFCYFEKFDHPDKVRSNFEGNITGLEDTIILDGTDLKYEPFWYRTFRFVRLIIQTENEAVVVCPSGFLETGYPLEVCTEVKASDEWVDGVWDMCVRTLKRCMMETYMDCPYYEQMQFIMDTRLQALFTYCTSNDTHLAKKAIEDFHHSMVPDGLVQGKYPSAYIQVISTFSLHYIYMLKEYLVQTGDTEFIKQYRPDVDAILGHYDRLIGPAGLVENLDYWPFVDWRDEWNQTYGAPAATGSGPSAIINLMYAYALLCAADICNATGRAGLAKEYHTRRKSIVNEIQKQCWSETEQLYREGPAFEQYSQHAQAWAVLNGMLSEADSKKLMHKALHQDSIIRCTFATGYELYRALEISGLYDEIVEMLDSWRHLLQFDCTTCPEVPVNSRSECHAWSALPIHIFVRYLAGVGMEGDAWEGICIKPNMGKLKNLSGKVTTPRGQVSFSYISKNGKIYYTVSVPEGCNSVFVYPNGNRILIMPGENILYYPAK